MVFGSPEGRDRVSPISSVIGDPLARRICVPEGRSTPTQIVALVAARTGSLADIQLEGGQHGRVDLAAFLAYAVSESCRGGVAVVPPVCAEHVIKVLAAVQAKEYASKARVARGQTTGLWERSHNADSGVEKV